jgi:hydroxypyruvate isomerase
MGYETSVIYHPEFAHNFDNNSFARSTFGCILAHTSNSNGDLVNLMRRRDFVISAVAATTAAAQTPPQVKQRKGRLKQTVMKVVFDPRMSFDEMCRHAAELGVKGMDTIPVQDWPTLKKYGLIPTMGPTGGVTFQDGLIRKETHNSLEKSMGEALDLCAANGCPNMITVGGQRRGMSNAEGADNAVAMLNRLKAHAEDKGVTICLEIMNSKYENPEFGRKDQICDHTAWGVEVCKRVNSPRVKLLFSIYHVQIMDGDVVANIRDNMPWIAHFDTGGVPGRHEIDETQELNYRFIAKTIADLGFTGYVCHEYKPTPGLDPIATLAKVLDIMDV